jgi:hypothetical protein
MDFSLMWYWGFVPNVVSVTLISPPPAPPPLPPQSSSIIFIFFLWMNGLQSPLSSLSLSFSVSCHLLSVFLSLLVPDWSSCSGSFRTSLCFKFQLLGMHWLNCYFITWRSSHILSDFSKVVCHTKICTVEVKLLMCPSHTGVQGVWR